MSQVSHKRSRWWLAIIVFAIMVGALILDICAFAHLKSGDDRFLYLAAFNMIVLVVCGPAVMAIFPDDSQ